MPYPIPVNPAVNQLPQKRPSEEPVNYYERPQAQAQPGQGSGTFNITFKPVTFGDDQQPSQPKRKRLQALKMTPEELKAEQQRQIALRKEKEAAEAPIREEERRQREAQIAAEREKERELIIQQKTARVMAYIKSEGLTLDRLWIELMKTKDTQQAGWVTRVLNAHGTEMADAMVAKRPKVFDGWVKEQAMKSYDEERKKLSKKLKSDQKKAVKAAFTHMAQWQVLDEMGKHAPVLLEAVNKIRVDEEQEKPPGESSSKE